MTGQRGQIQDNLQLDLHCRQSSYLAASPVPIDHSYPYLVTLTHLEHIAEVLKTCSGEDQGPRVRDLGCLKENDIHGRFRSGHPEIIIVGTGYLPLNPVTRLQAGEGIKVDDTINFGSICDATANSSVTLHLID